MLLALRGGLILSCLCLSVVLGAQRTATPYAKLADQPEITSLRLSPERGTPSLIELDPVAKSATPDNAPALLDRFFGLTAAGLSTTFDKTTTDRSGLRVDRFQEYYRGVKVEHGRYNAVSSGNELLLISSEHYAVDPKVSVTPTLSRDQALQRALIFVGAKEYAWDFIQKNYVRGVWAPDFAAHVDAELQAVLPGGELTLVDNYSTPETDVDLAWKFNIYATEPLSRAWIFVNAHSGEIMLKNAIIKHASEPVTVETRYAGVRQINVDRQTNGLDPHNGLPLLDSRTNAPASTPLYVLRDDTRGDGLETYDMNGVGGVPLSLPSLYAQGKAFTDDDLNWTLAEHKRGGTTNEAENDDIAWDAHWGTQVVYDYWLDVHGRRSYDDNDIVIKSFLHYGVAYDNAFWNGSAMTYGDGSYQGGTNPDGTFAPLMSLDVCAHEVGHAICTHTADLVYAKESGAMNEGFSDIWGAAVEAYAFRAVDAGLASTMAPWGIGEQIDERDGGIQYPANGWRALRYMDEPGRAGDPDTYGGANWANPDCDPNLANDQCGVHTNSGVLNKWFFLLTAGENGTNDLGDAYSVSGLGFEVSERIAYGTELLLTPNATFAEARAASIAFVRALSEAGGGNCNNYERQVTNAWFGVGVGDAFDCAQVASFVTKSSFANEMVANNAGCGASKIITIEASVVGNGRVTTGGTAIRGVDYRLLNDRFRTGGGGFGTHEFQIEIFDDGLIEGDETILLSLGRGTTHKLTLLDDDVPLVVGGTRTLLDNSMRGSLPAGWTVVDNVDGPNSWFGSANVGAHVSLEVTNGGAPVYDGNGAEDLILASPAIDARGTRNVHVTFDWAAGGETDVPPALTALDFGTLAYSFDGVTFTDFGEYDPFVGAAVASVTTGTFDATLPDFLQGTTFYLGWRWRSDGLVNGTYSFSFENLTVTAENPGIATTVTSGSQDLPPRANVTFYTPDNAAAIVKIDNATGYDFGCTTVDVVTAGNGKNRCSGGIFLDKTYRIRTSNPRSNRNFEVSFFLSDAEIEGFESATGLDRDELTVYYSEDFVCSFGAERQEAAYVLIEEVAGGIMLLASVNAGGEFFSIGTEDNFLPVFLTSFEATTDELNSLLSWTAFETDFEGYEVQRSLRNAEQFSTIGYVTAIGTKDEEASYSFTDPAVAPGQEYVYRLAQRHTAGDVTFSDLRNVKLPAETTVLAFPNPFTASFRVRTEATSGTARLYNLSGQELRNVTITGTTTEVEANDLPTGAYLLRITDASGRQETIRVVKR